MAEKVLVVDDDENTVCLTSTNLKHKGFEVIEAFTPEEGLKAAHQKTPAIIHHPVRRNDTEHGRLGSLLPLAGTFRSPDYLPHCQDRH